MTQTLLSQDDFDKILDDFAGRLVTKIPVTKTVSNVTGEETLSDGTSTSIKAYFIRAGQRFDWEKAGFIEAGDAVLLAKISDGVTTNDKIVADGRTYRVKEAFNVPGQFNTSNTIVTMAYTACNLFLLS